MENRNLNIHNRVNQKRDHLNENSSVLLETEEYFIPINMDIERDPFEWLVAGLKTTADNLGILHRNLTGEDFFSIHEVFEEYYKKMYEILDDIIEIIIGLGGRELSMYEACRICPSLKVQGFTSGEAFKLTKKMFEMLINGFERCESTVPGDVYSKFEEYIYWLRKEMSYKINRFMRKI